MSASFPDGYHKHVLATVDSTNAEAARIAGSLSSPTWILGLKQTAGRGRGGRQWADPQGNFAATLVLFPDDPLQTRVLRSFVAALALFDALVTLTGRAEAFSLKWPNDVLLNGGKLAGILLETVPLSAGRSALAIGMGVNLVEAPSLAELSTGSVPPVSLQDATGSTVTAEEFLDFLAVSYAACEEQFSTFGFEPIRRAWLARAARLGEVITARSGQAEVSGIFDTIDETGHLILKTAEGKKAIAAADVFF
ncbi:MAG: biotin--[acetyl-CoA-carboxylase] ligase [Paracoccaceae bacterium]